MFGCMIKETRKFLTLTHFRPKADPTYKYKWVYINLKRHTLKQSHFCSLTFFILVRDSLLKCASIKSILPSKNLTTTNKILKVTQPFVSLWKQSIPTRLENYSTIGEKNYVSVTEYFGQSVTGIFWKTHSSILFNKCTDQIL